MIFELYKKTFEDFWKANASTMIKLSETVRKICIINATSCPSEAAFSVAGYLDRKSRAKLSSKTLRYTMLMKDNEKIQG